MTLTTDNPRLPPQFAALGIADGESVVISRAEYEALMAAAEALKRYHHPPSRIDAPDCPCCNCEGERAIAALRAAGIDPLEGKAS